jgi:ribosomal protein S18 acetylase RimI-like enzyme
MPAAEDTMSTISGESGQARVRPATPDDAALMARLIDIAAAGLPSHLWSTTAEPGQSPLEVGEARARRDSGGFSWRNAIMAEVDGRPVGMLLGYRLEAPTEEDRAALAELPDLVRPFIELEHEVPGTFYINAFAVLEGFRGRGIGAALLEAARQRAAELGCALLSVQAFSENPRSVAFYERHGFRRIAERPVVPHPCYPYTDRTLLLVRPA